ncbi:MAG TPA: hypothetical protein VFB38_23120 [Chthonomonadaceae bacterium]|nr:hypothetical protein [Chthonomonadaceae bacterium]
MPKRRFQLLAMSLALLAGLLPLGLLGCGSKDESDNDPNYYKGSDFKGKSKAAGVKAEEAAPSSTGRGGPQ